MAISFKGAHFPQDIILMGVRWYLAYPLSYRHVEELLEERGVPIDHATIQRWVVKYSPLLEEAFHRRKRPVWVSWRMDETYIKVKGQWYYLSRAVDKTGQTIDFLLTAQRDKRRRYAFSRKRSAATGCPRRSPSTGVRPMRRRSRATTRSTVRPSPSARSSISTISWNKTIEAVKRVTRPMLGFKSFDAAQGTLVGVELMHMIKKKQMMIETGDEGRTAAELFYSLAA